jgi:hypothetical protein
MDEEWGREVILSSALWWMALVLIDVSVQLVASRARRLYGYGFNGTV